MAGAEHIPGDDGEAFAVSPAERRLWLLHQLEPSDPAYHLCLPVRIRGGINPSMVRSVVAAIERRHPMLRSTYVEQNGDLRRHVRLPSALVITLIDVPSAAAVEAIVRDLSRRPFDLDAGPPARWTLVRVDPQHHVLVLAVHHIVFDGGSLPALCAELTALSHAFAGGFPEPAAPACAPNPVGSVSTPARIGADPDLRFWREHLADPPPPVKIWPPDAGMAGPLAAAATVSMVLDRQTAGLLRGFARGSGATLPMVLLAALSATLYRYTGREDIVIGTPVSLRDSPAETGFIGLRLNLLPLRTRLSPAITFELLVAACRDAVLDGVEHRGTPFESIVDAVGAERSPWHSPLFQALFAYQHAPVPPTFPHARVELMTPPTPAAKYPLSVAATETPDAITLTFEADARQCRQSVLAAFGRHYVALLVAAITDARRPIGRLPLAAPPRYRRRAEYGAGPVASATLHGLVERTAAARPDAIAVYGHDGHLTYAALDRRANQFARELLAAGAGPEHVVGVYLPRTPDLLVALLAVAKAGAAYLPLDPHLPRERLHGMLADARASIVVTHSSWAGQLAHDGTETHTDSRATALRPASRPAVRAHPANLAYVLYTSGSSGAPKGVAISHASAVGFLSWAARDFGSEDLAAVVALTSVGFDLSVFELFAPLVVGGAVVLVDGPLRLSEHPMAGRGTLLNTVPSVLEGLLDAGTLPGQLLAVNLAGEPLPRDLVTRLRCERPALRVRNLYGPSEATTYVTSAEVDDGEREPPIGAAVAGARLWLVDACSSPVPEGVIGAALVGGPSLARGYLNRPGLTARSFVPDHLGDVAGARLYRTGDLVREGNDGQLWFIGRRDHQIKLRGVRIELEEIEALLREHPDVRDAAVAVSGDSSRDRHLVAFVCPRDGARPTEAELAGHLRERLPAVMTPTRWSTLDELPRTPNGKLDRHTLARAASRVGGAQVGTVAPRSPIEATIARAWCETLGRPLVGVHDGFFDIGGTSLLLLRLHGLLRERIDPRLRVVDLFRWPTVASLARHLVGDGPHEVNPDDAATAGQNSAARRRAMASRRRQGSP